MNNLEFDKTKSVLKYRSFVIRGLVLSTVNNGNYNIVKLNGSCKAGDIELEVAHASSQGPVIVCQNLFILQRVQSWLNDCEGGILNVHE